MSKPTVFNYNDFLRMQEERDKLKEENWELQEKIAQLQIRCRIAEENLKEWQEAVIYVKVPEIPGPGDAINREDAISHFRELAETLRGEYGDLGGACCGAAKFLERMPRADAKPREHGHWIAEESDEWAGGGAWICSCCGYGFSWKMFNMLDEEDYCPHCGAELGGRKDDEITEKGHEESDDNAQAAERRNGNDSAAEEQ